MIQLVWNEIDHQKVEKTYQTYRMMTESLHVLHSAEKARKFERKVNNLGVVDLEAWLQK